MMQKKPAALTLRVTRPQGRRRQALDVTAKLERIRQRGLVGSLTASLIRPQTLRLYHKACEWFFAWIYLTHTVLPREVWDFDLRICECIEMAWEEGEPRALIGNMLSGLEFLVAPLRGQIKASWRLWRAWGNAELPARAPPFTLNAVFALCYYFVHWNQPSAAVLTLLGFDRFLRTSEFVSLTSRQLNFETNLKTVLIQFPESKGARRSGMEGVLVTNQPLVQHLHRLVLARPAPHEPLLGLSMAQYRKLFSAACLAVGLGDDFKPYGLRRGGATLHFRENNNMGATMEIGRWSEIRTARIYINTALLALTTMQELSSDRIENAAQHFQYEFKYP